MLTAPAAERNKGPILAVLRQYLLPQGATRLLEVASGTGQHAAHLAAGLSDRLLLQPSEADPAAFASIETHCRGLANVLLPPLLLDIARLPCAEPPFPPDIVLCANMIHISSTQAVEGLFSNAGRLLQGGGRLVTYGPYAIDGRIYPESNVSFDQSLRARNPDWGLRDTGYLDGLAEANGLRRVARHEMPANNWTLVFEKFE